MNKRIFNMVNDYPNIPINREIKDIQNELIFHKLEKYKIVHNKFNTQVMLPWGKRIVIRRNSIIREGVEICSIPYFSRVSSSPS